MANRCICDVSTHSDIAHCSVENAEAKTVFPEIRIASVVMRFRNLCIHICQF